jgi:hypothetical protein
MQICHPLLCLGIGRGDREVLIQHDDSRPTHRRLRSNCCRRNDGASQALGQMRDQTTDQRDLGNAEPSRPVAAMQAEHTPAATSRYQRRPKLVTQPERCHDVDVPGAGRSVV